MNNGFDYITSGNYAGDWLQIQFLAETVATLTPHTGDSVTGTFAAGQQLVGTFVEVNVTSGVMLAYRRGATAKRSLFTGLLDTYGGAAAAYSLRKLRAAYSGSAIRVRESGSNTEADIGFNADGTLNTTALLAHCGANDGFVVTWYDQAGSNNATQATAANQPQIVSGGSIVLENGNAAIDFDGVGHFLKASASITDYPATNIIVQRNAATNAGYSWSLNNDSSATNYYTNTDISSLNIAYHSVRNSANVFITAAWASAIQNSIFAWSAANNNHNFTINGGSVNSSTNVTTFPNANNIAIGRLRFVTTALFYDGIIQELIVWNSDQSANRTAIESNINAHYNIYP